MNKSQVEYMTVEYEMIRYSHIEVTTDCKNTRIQEYKNTISFPKKTVQKIPKNANTIYGETYLWPVKSVNLFRGRGSIIDLQPIYLRMLILMISFYK